MDGGESGSVVRRRKSASSLKEQDVVVSYAPVEVEKAGANTDESAFGVGKVKETKSKVADIIAKRSEERRVGKECPV